MQSFIRTNSRPRERARDTESDARVAVVSIVSFSAHPLLCKKNLKSRQKCGKDKEVQGRVLISKGALYSLIFTLKKDRQPQRFLPHSAHSSVFITGFI